MTCQFAAEKGHLHILKWAIENGAILMNEEHICCSVVMNAHLHIFKWARENGYFLNWIGIFSYAKMVASFVRLRWNLEIFLYMKQNNLCSEVIRYLEKENIFPSMN